jgi:HTH-type transcriptional regulator / antitoxin HipB
MRKIFLYGKLNRGMLMVRSAAEFGALVREHRKKLGWTQTELAERCGTGERFIVDLENGKPSCQLEKSLIAARTVGIDLGDLKSVTLSLPPEAEDDLGYLPRFC